MPGRDETSTPPRRPLSLFRLVWPVAMALIVAAFLVAPAYLPGFGWSSVFADAPSVDRHDWVGAHHRRRLNFAPGFETHRSPSEPQSDMTTGSLPRQRPSDRPAERADPALISPGKPSVLSREARRVTAKPARQTSPPRSSTQARRPSRIYRPQSDRFGRDAEADRMAWIIGIQRPAPRPAAPQSQPAPSVGPSGTSNNMSSDASDGTEPLSDDAELTARPALPIDPKDAYRSRARSEQPETNAPPTARTSRTPSRRIQRGRSTTRNTPRPSSTTQRAPTPSVRPRPTVRPARRRNVDPGYAASPGWARRAFGAN